MTRTTTVAAPPLATPRALGQRRGLPPAVWRGAVGILVAIALAQLIPSIGLVNPRFLPPASDVGGALGALSVDAAFWTALGQTMLTWAIGLAIAIAAGLIAGILIGSSPVARAFTNSTIEFLRPIPSVALMPLTVLVLGVTMRSAIVLIIYSCFWQMIVQVLYGTKDVDPVARDTARTFGSSRFQILRQVVWPTVLPYAVTGVRLSATIALVLTIMAELVIGVPGLGRMIAVAQESGAVPRMYALILVTGVLGLLVNLVVRAIERRVLRWHVSVRLEVA